MITKDEQLIRKYFGNKVIIEKISCNYALLGYVSMSYFTPKGKARLATKKEYRIINLDLIEDEYQDEFVCWTRTKSEGLKILSNNSKTFK